MPVSTLPGRRPEEHSFFDAIAPYEITDEELIAPFLPALKLVQGNSSKERFAVDIDSTLYDFSTVAREQFLKHADDLGDESLLRGAYISWVEWRSPADACGIDVWKHVISMCHSPEVIERQQPFPGAAETLQELADYGHELIYISNRDPSSVGATTRWLEDHGFPVIGDSVHCLWGDKAPLLADCRYLIDDRPKTLVEFVYDPNWDIEGRGKRKGLSLLYEYNRALTDIPDIFLSPTWQGIASWLKRKELVNV